ncbi:FAD-dependent monooxygenase phqK [Pseudocercospora fuligena]|uniref:FAD-dependent monooxygenase phqK n=1 Tax=Pseudocercospora fuligena TaxID=685502 RepID=A0A8H6RE60_9PEZI|nr:FAD-dependent monooxygenase phqK [Pseudocercospora fuligena]
MASSTPFQIIIVGAGIGGVAAAVALRAPGRQITILEQSRLNHEIGATISLQPNASRILVETWKLSEVEQELAKGMVDHGFRVYNTEGNMVNEIKLKGGKYGAERIMYHRQDLHESLKAAATSPNRPGPPAVIRVSSRVTACDCESGTITLASGEQIQADLVVAADGIHSTIRADVLGHPVQPLPTGLSAYRLMVDTSILEQSAPGFCANINPREPYTSMIMAHSCRLIMGPARNGELYSVVGLVPDERMNEDPNANQSWVSRGDLNKMLDTYSDFPEWTKEPFKLAKDIGLWQLRDIDPLPTWTKGRAILIGDAAHAMLPTQGQGASQTIEDAEALGAFFEDVSGVPDAEQLQSILRQVVECRHKRASLIQRYSRDAARPATEEGDKEVKMNPGEFMDYNCSYKGAMDWQQRHSVQVSA